MGEAVTRLLGEQSARFFAECWPNTQQHLFATGMRDRFPELFADPCATNLASLLEAHRGPITAQGFDGLGNFRAEKGLDAKSASLLLRFGIPIQLYEAQKTIPAIRELERGLRSDLGLPASTIVSMIFVSPPGRGVLKHFDDKDVWIIGLSGKKVLWVAPNQDVPFPAWIETIGQAPLAATSSEAPDMPPGAVRVELGCGDSLFLPRGYWHESANGDATSFSLTLALNRPTVLDLCLDALRDRLLKLPAFREPFPGLGPGATASRQRLEAVLKQLPQEIAGLDAESVTHAYLTRSLLRAHRIVTGRALEVTERLVTVSREPDGDALAEIEISTETAPVFRAISRSNAITLTTLHKDFPDITPATLGSIVEALIEADFLEAIG